MASLYFKLTDGDRILNPPKSVALANLLPFGITVILMRGEPGSGIFKPLATVPAGRTISVPYPGSSYDTKITCIKGTTNDVEGIASLPPLTKPIYFGSSSKYFFGAFAWNSVEMDTNGYNLYADIPGIRIHNHFPYPIEVTYKNLVFTLGKGSWRSFVGGSPGIVYFDNQGNGVDVGDTFSVNILDERKIKAGEFKIPNRYVRNVHIGVTSTP